MKKLSKTLLLTLLVVGASSSLTACGEDDSLTLRIINSEDYIYIQEDESDKPDMVDQFVDYITGEESPYPQYKGKKVSVVYDTSDTNETLYSELQTGKSNYDLMNVSDYMAQKIVAGGMAVPFYEKGQSIPNYETYASEELKNRVNSIEAVQKVYDETQGKYVDQVVTLEQYAVGYMWGTLGILFNPDYKDFQDVGAEQVITDMQDFDALWDFKYQGTISIKNSMRDTYALGIFNAYKEEFQQIREEYLRDVETNPETALETYQSKFSEIFNRCDEKAVKDVAESLEALKQNIFGLEVDSGKQDIITRKIGVNLAWSGDAVYSMDQGEDGKQVGENTVELCYAVPELGSNIWSDLWIMPNCPRSDEQYELAHLFLNFISNPENAAQNMNYTGYTSFIGGDSVIDLVRDWYDSRTDEIYEEVEVEKYEFESYQVYSINESQEFTALCYEDFLMNSHDSTRDNDVLRYFVPYENKEKEIVEEPTSYDELLENSEEVILVDENGENEDRQKTYGDLTIVDAEDSEIEVVDLSYFFNGTLDEYAEEDMIFYSDCYLPFTYTNDQGEEIQNISVGRQFFAQYPNQETINRCSMMKDYGENNKNVMKMWENFKSNPLPLWAIITFIVVLAGLLAFATYMIVNAVIKKKIRLARKGEEEKPANTDKK